MKVNKNDWVELKNKETLFGFDIYLDGKWCHVMVDNEPLLFESEPERDKKMSFYARLRF